MAPQAYKDEVQPGEEAPAGDENTTDAFLYPPQQKKSKPYMVWFKRAGVCVGVGLLSIVIAFVIALLWMTNFWRMPRVFSWLLFITYLCSLWSVD